MTDRRGDATGPVALLFLGALVMVFVVGAAALISLPALVVDPTAGPDGTPRTAASLAPAGTPAAPATDAPPTSQPQPTRMPSPDPGQTPGSLPSRQPSTPAPTATGAIIALRTGTFGEAVPLVVDGQRLGSVNVRSLTAGELEDIELPAGARVMVLEVRIGSAAGLGYDAADWVVVDTEGGRHPSLGDRAPGAPLASGRLEPGEARVGTIAFIRERGMTFARFVLTDGDGTDLVSVSRPGLAEATEGG